MTSYTVLMLPVLCLVCMTHIQSAARRVRTCKRRGKLWSWARLWWSWWDSRLEWTSAALVRWDTRRSTAPRAALLSKQTKEIIKYNKWAAQKPTQTRNVLSRTSADLDWSFRSPGLSRRTKMFSSGTCCTRQWPLCKLLQLCLCRPTTRHVNKETKPHSCC